MKTSHPYSRHPRPEERRFLEALCLWRGLYAHRGPRDRVVVETLDDAIAGAELRIRARRMRDEQMLRRFGG